jgi:hypothetical protein
VNDADLSRLLLVLAKSLDHDSQREGAGSSGPTRIAEGNLPRWTRITAPAAERLSSSCRSLYALRTTRRARWLSQKAPGVVLRGRWHRVRLLTR